MFAYLLIRIDQRVCKTISYSSPEQQEVNNGVRVHPLVNEFIPLLAHNVLLSISSAPFFNFLAHDCRMNCLHQNNYCKEASFKFRIKIHASKDIY